MARMTQITPFVMVSDLHKSLAFFEKTLGFKCGFLGEQDGYAFIRRDNVAIRLLETDCDLDNPARQQVIYIDVEDVDGVFAELEPELKKLPKERVRAPFDRHYNQREFHVIDEDAALLMFGEGIKPKGNA